MPTTPEAVRPIELSEIQAARERIARTICARRWSVWISAPAFPDIRLKLENLQPTNAYKLRGAANAVGCSANRSATAAFGPSAPVMRAKASPMPPAKRGCRARSSRSTRRPPRSSSG